jgi:polysaccharide transporter, PST family
MAVRLGAELRNVLSNVLWKAVSMPLEKACRLLLVVGAARVLGQEVFGRFQFAATLTILLALGTDLGLGLWTTRALARSRTRAEAIVATGLRVRTLAAAPYLAVIGTLAIALGPGDARVAILLLGVCALVDGFVDHFGGVLRGYERFDDEARLIAARALLLATVGGAAVWLGRSLVWLTVGMTAASLAAGAYGLWIIGRRYRLPTPFDRGTFDRALAAVAIREALPLWLAGLFSLLYFKGDAVLLRVFAGESELGAYSAAFKVFEGSMLLPAILMTAAFPSLARAHGDVERQRRWERLLAAVLLGLGLLVGVICHLGSGRIVGLAFGGDFGRAVASLQVLAWGIPLLYLNHGLIYFLIARDLGHRNLVFAGLMLVLNVSVNLILIPRLGGPGAGWATVITEGALLACCLLALAGTPRATTSPPPAAPAPDRNAT